MKSDSRPAAWVKLAEPENFTEGEFPPNHPYNFGSVPAMARLIQAHPRIGPYFGRLVGSIMFAPGALSRAEREMIAAVTAAAQDCHY